MDYKALNMISPFVRSIRVEERSVFGNWMDYDNVITYIENGIIEYVAKGHTYTLNEGHCILVAPHTSHIIKTPSKTVTHYVLHFDYFFSPERANLSLIGAERYIGSYPDDFLFPVSETPLDNDIYIVKLDEMSELRMKDNMVALLRLRKEKNHLTLLNMKTRLLDILVTIFECYSAENSFSVQKNVFWPTIKRVLQYINTHYSNNRLDLDNISKAAGASKNYLAAEFKKITGLSIYNYILNVRISKANELIILGEHSITKIAELTGFSSIYSFSRTFKNITGMSPKRFYTENLHDIEMSLMLD